jgi:hypothetical protein
VIFVFRCGWMRLRWCETQQVECCEVGLRLLVFQFLRFVVKATSGITRESSLSVIDKYGPGENISKRPGRTGVILFRKPDSEISSRDAYV